MARPLPIGGWRCDAAEGEERPPFEALLEASRRKEGPRTGRGAGRRKGGAPPYKRRGRGESLVGRLSLNESCWRVPVIRSFVRSGSGSGRVGSSNLVEVQLFLAEGQSVQSRDPASGTERLQF